MPTIRDIEAKLEELEDDQEPDGGESLADAWRRALGKDPETGEVLTEAYREERER